MAELRIRATATNPRRILSPQKLQQMLDETLLEVAKDSEIIFAAHALHATGRMARNIRSDKIGQDIIVHVEARDPVSGFDYVRITRFGHRVLRIFPKRILAATREAVVLATGRTRGRGRQAALRFIIGGRVMYRHSVKGFHPATDWADNAMPQIRRRAEQRVKGLGRRIEVEWST